MTVLHPLVALAHQTIEGHILHKRQLDPPEHLGSEFARPAGAFVTLRHHGLLRGCIGTIEPTQDNVAQEVMRNAISAATQDPRFEPVRPDELEGLEIKVDVLSPPEPIEGPDELDPRRYGLIVQSLSQSWKRGLLLPDLEGIDTVEKQVHWTRHHKAGITDPDEPVQMYRFEVHRFK